MEVFRMTQFDDDKDAAWSERVAALTDTIDALRAEVRDLQKAIGRQVLITDEQQARADRAEADLAAARADPTQAADAALERAALAVANVEIGYHDGISGDWHPFSGPVILSKACAAIRALQSAPAPTALQAALDVPEVRALVEAAILDAQLRATERGRIDTPDEIRDAALAALKAAA
jgi:hypothetical protein